MLDINIQYTLDISHSHQLVKSKQKSQKRMPSSGMLRHVALARTDVSEDFSASIDSILHNHRRETLKSYIALTGWAL
jgi:hypothetical protein